MIIDNGKCIESLNSSGKELMELNIDFNMDENASCIKFKLVTIDFFEDFGKSEYTVYGKIFIVV